MQTLIRREFEVQVPLDFAWNHLANVTEWPRWAHHIKRIDLVPSGSLGEKSSGVIFLSNGIRSTFHMTEFHPFRHWMWAGSFLWLTIHYDHRFEAIGAARTRLIWIVDVGGIGISILGKLFAWIYGGNLNKAIPKLVAQMGEEFRASSSG